MQKGLLGVEDRLRMLELSKVLLLLLKTLLLLEPLELLKLLELLHRRLQR